LVSHDRYFIDRLATRIFQVGEGKVEIFPGNYEDYLWRKQGGAAEMQERLAASSKSAPIPIAAPAIVSSDGDSKSKRLNPIKRKQIEDRVQELERKISHLESSIEGCELALQNFVSAEEIERQARELGKHKAELQNSMAEWEELGQALQA
jgi:ATP-binding cassette subfamily F protein 3